MEQNNRYRDLSSYAHELHEKNKKRVKVSGIVLILLPVVLGLIRWLTDSDKLVFLLIWVLCMFMIAAYLIGVAYLDESIQKKLAELTGREEDFDGLIDRPDSLGGKLGETVSVVRDRRRTALRRAGIFPAAKEDELPMEEQAEDSEEGGRS